MESEVIHSGWLTKSPGAKYASILNGKVRLPLKSKWRRRFFMLSKPRSSLPDEFELKYYKESDGRREMGSVDLQSCCDISLASDSAFYPFLFTLSASSKKYDKRTYYLAADTQEEMDEWMHILRRICHLGTDAQPVNQVTSARPVVEQEVPIPTRTNPVNTTEDSDNEDYESPPPMYDSPLSVRNHIANGSRNDSKSNSSHSEMTSTRPTSNESDESGRQQLYDVPPSRKEIEQANILGNQRPKPLPLNNNRSTPPDIAGQQRISDEVFPIHNDNITDDIYDIPRSAKVCHTNPPQCSGSTSKLHSYINASNRHVIEAEMYSTTQSSSTDDAQLSHLNGHLTSDMLETKVTAHKEAEIFTFDGYTRMDQTNYELMASSPGLSLKQRESASSDTYDVLPPTKPVKLHQIGKSVSQNSDVRLPVRNNANTASSSSEPVSSDDETKDEIYDVPPSRQPVPREITPKRPPKPEAISRTRLPSADSPPPPCRPKNSNANNNVQYVVLDQSADTAPVRTYRPPPRPNTQYTDIDVIKTQALRARQLRDGP